MAVQQQNSALTAQIKQNSDFMKYSYLQVVKGDVQNSNTYAAGSSGINWDVPIQTGGWAERITLRCVINFNYTPAGTGPTVSTTAAAPWNVIQEIRVTYGNQQISLHPFIAAKLAQMRGYTREFPGQTLANSVSDVQSQIYSFPAITSGANTWKIDIDVPLNLLHPNSVVGLIPISGSGTRLQVTAIPATAFSANNADPLNVPINTNGTISVTNTSTVDCYVWYRNHRSFSTRTSLQPNIAGLPTVQVIRVPSINPLTANTWNFKRFTNPYPFVKAVSVVIDGQSSGTFCAATNINGIELDEAENQSSKFWGFDTTNGGMTNYFRRIREIYGQDFEDGFLPIVDAPAGLFGGAVPDSDLQSGDTYLNLTSNGYPAARMGVNVQTVSQTNFTPRVDTWAVILNTEGLKLA